MIKTVYYFNRYFGKQNSCLIRAKMPERERIDVQAVEECRWI